MMAIRKRSSYILLAVTQESTNTHVRGRSFHWTTAQLQTAEGHAAEGEEGQDAHKSALTLRPEHEHCRSP